MGDARFHLSMLIPDWGALARFGGQGALVGAILAFLFGGVVRVATRSRTRPNEGIRLSSRNALRAGVLAALVQFAILTPALYLFRDPEHWLKGIWGSNSVADKTILIPASAAILGILLGVNVALWYGGFEIIQHTHCDFCSGKGSMSRHTSFDFSTAARNSYSSRKSAAAISSSPGSSSIILQQWNRRCRRVFPHRKSEPGNLNWMPAWNFVLPIIMRGLLKAWDGAFA